MAYSDYNTLFTIGGTKFPEKWMYKESYSVTPHALDLDSTRTTTGELQRNVLDNKSCTVKFETVPMTFEEYEEMWAFIRSKYVDQIEKKLTCYYYNFETGQLEPIGAGGYGYVPDVEHTPYSTHSKIKYMLQSTIEIIGY